MADTENLPQKLSASPMHTLAVTLRVHVGPGDPILKRNPDG